MDDYSDDRFLFLAHAQRLHHVDVQAQSFAHAHLYGVRRDVVRLDVDNFAGVRAHGYIWEESEIYRYAEVLAKDHALVCAQIPMEGDCVFDVAFGDFFDLSRRGVARIAHYRDRIFVDYIAVFLEYSIHGIGNGADRSGDNGDIFKGESPIPIQQRSGK